MQPENIKEKAYRLLDNLPEQATWEDLMYRRFAKGSDQMNERSFPRLSQRFSGMRCSEIGMVSPEFREFLDSTCTNEKEPRTCVRNSNSNYFGQQ